MFTGGILDRRANEPRCILGHHAFTCCSLANDTGTTRPAMLTWVSPDAVPVDSIQEPAIPARQSAGKSAAADGNMACMYGPGLAIGRTRGSGNQRTLAAAVELGSVSVKASGLVVSR
jgi:hypothetical protein